MKRNLDRITLLFLILILVTACGGTSPEATTTSEPTTETQTEATAVVQEQSATEPPTETTPNPEVVIAVPTEEPGPEPTQAPGNAEGVPLDTPNDSEDNVVEFNDISFSYPVDLASGVKAETIEAPGQPQQGPGWNNPPTYDLFTFEDYIISEGFPTANIAIYPVLETASRSTFAKDQIETLQDILTNQPETPEQLPYLPLVNASMVFSTQFSYQNFASGDGIRYVTMFAQSINPITNQGLFYTFQGLTSDGQYYVSATFPVRTEMLPDEIPADTDWDALAANYDTYINEAVTTLDGLSNSDFEPDLSVLDNTVATIKVEKEETARNTDANGNLLLTIVYPVDGSETRIGETLPVAGYVDPAYGSAVTITLTAGTNTLAGATAVVDPTTGDWTAELVVPLNVQGRGNLVAATESEETAVDIYIGPSSGTVQPATGEPVVRLFRPYSGETAVAGYPVYFEGDVQNPIDNLVGIGVLIEGCTTWDAQQSFTVEGGGTWQGVVLLPADILDDTACATAYTGVYGEGDWREVQSSLPILSPDDERANRIGLENSTYQFKAGETGTVAGYAVNAPEVKVTFINQETQEVIAEGVTSTADFGLWEIKLAIPEDAPEFIAIQVELITDEASDPYTLTTGATILQ